MLVSGRLLLHGKHAVQRHEHSCLLSIVAFAGTRTSRKECGQIVNQMKGQVQFVTSFHATDKLTTLVRFTLSRSSFTLAMPVAPPQNDAAILLHGCR